MDRKRIKLETVDAVLEALGGTPAVQELTAAKTYQVIHNCRARGCFPSKFYVVMTRRLMELGYDAPAALWGQVEGDESALGKPTDATVT